MHTANASVMARTARVAPFEVATSTQPQHHHHQDLLFYNPPILLAFLMECLEWRSSFGGIYVVGGSSRGLLHGEHKVDYFYHQQDIIEYCRRHQFHLRHADLFQHWYQRQCQRQQQQQQAASTTKRRRCYDQATSEPTTSVFSNSSPSRKRARCLPPSSSTVDKSCSYQHHHHQQQSHESRLPSLGTNATVETWMDL